MSNPATVSALSEPTSVLNDFTGCHADITRHLDTLGALPALLEAATRARLIAQDAVSFFDDMIRNHHEDEERELFPAVRKAAQRGAEHTEAVALIERLTADHRHLEADWRRIRPQLEQIANGRSEQLDFDAAARLVAGYKAHAHFEETRFLPLAQRILSRHDPELAELGYALHIRHAIKNTPTFI